MATAKKNGQIIVRDAVGPTKGQPGICTPGDAGPKGFKGPRGNPGPPGGLAPFLIVPGVEDVTVPVGSNVDITLGKIMGGKPPYTRVVTGLPENIVHSGRTISGQGIIGGRHPIVYTVTDSATPQATSRQTFTIDLT